MTLDDKTFEKSLLSTVVNLKQAYQMTKKLDDATARDAVKGFIQEEVISKLLGLDPHVEVRTLQEIIIRAIDKMLEEYKGKPEKAYTALLRLKEAVQ